MTVHAILEYAEKLTSCSCTESTSFLPILVFSSTATAQTLTCTDGGTLHCCQATFVGDLPLTVFLSGEADYSLTLADVDCILT